MPRRDGTGPTGIGSKTGRGMGICNTTRVAGAIEGLGLGLGLGCRRGFGMNNFSNTINSENQKDLLKEQKTILKNRIDLIDKELNTLQDHK